MGTLSKGPERIGIAFHSSMLSSDKAQRHNGLPSRHLTSRWTCVYGFYGYLIDLWTINDRRYKRTIHQLVRKIGFH
jgi:hypothetical protein